MIRKPSSTLLKSVLAGLLFVSFIAMSCNNEDNASAKPIKPVNATGEDTGSARPVKPVNVTEDADTASARPIKPVN